MPDYEITIAGRMGPVVASCLPGLRSVTPSATVLHALAANHQVVLQLLGLLADHHLTFVDVRIDPALTEEFANQPRQPAATTPGGPNPLRA